MVISAGDGQSEPLAADELPVATGRRPATHGLGLETLGLDADDYVQVDDSLRVPGRDRPYAVGDVSGRTLLTDPGTYQARVAADAVLARAAGGEHAILPR